MQLEKIFNKFEMKINLTLEAKIDLSKLWKKANNIEKE